jgi:hypothetical protein
MKLLAALVTAALFLGAPAHASPDHPLDPEKGPKTEGPVALDDVTCNMRPVRSDDGILLGNGEICIYLYSFDNLSELDPLRDYGAVWLQARFVPADGWCATAVKSELEMSGGTLEHIARAPSKPGKTTTKLALTARGNALEDALISQAWTAGPGAASNAAPAGELPAMSAAWQGKSAKPVSLVGGLAYSYEALQGAPGKIGYGISELSLASC